MNDNNNTESVLYAVGTRGYSAYEVAVQNGFVGTEQEWLDSLVGPEGPQGQPFDELTPEQKAEITGPEGKSAYEVAVEEGFEGTEEDFVNSYINADNYYNKTYIDENLNNISSKITREENERKTSDNNLQSQINGLENGTPLPASSTSEMTNTSRIYVNTTDGYCYYYNGNNWVQGWIYQSSINQEVIDARENFNGVSYKNLKDHLNTQFSSLYNDNMFKITYEDLQWRNSYINEQGSYSNVHDYLLTTGVALYAKKGSSIKIGSDYVFRVYRYTNNRAADTSNFIDRTEQIKEYVFTEDSYFRIMCLKGMTAEDDLWTNGEINELGQDLISSLELNIYIVGNELKEFKKTINPFFYIGNLSNTNGGVNWTNVTRLISGLYKINKCIIINNSSLYSFTVGMYDKNKNYLGYKDFNDNLYFYNIDNVNVRYIRVGIRNYPNSYFDFSTLTQEEIDDISNKITIYTNDIDYTDIISDNLSNNFLGENIITQKYIPKNLIKEREIKLDTFDIVNSSSFTHDTNVATQGLTSDKKRYLYVTIDNDDTNPCGLLKYDLLKDEIVNHIYETNYGHGNGITYIENKKELWIASFNYDSLTDLSRISKVDSDTLEFKEHIDLQEMLDTYFENVFEEVNGIGALTYNSIHNNVVYLIRSSTGKDAAQHRALLICDINNNPIKHVLIDNVFAGGIESDSNYIYVNRPANSYIDVYDWNLNYVEKITYNMPGESEGLVIMDKNIYSNANIGNGEIALYKLKATDYEFID